MTSILIDRKNWQIIADGHAGAGEADGTDQICCAVSTLMQTYLYATRRMGYQMEHEIRDGYLRVTHVRGGGPLTMEFIGAYNCTALGLEMLEAVYPEHLQVKKVF